MFLKDHLCACLQSCSTSVTISSSSSPFIWTFFFHVCKEALSLVSLNTFTISLVQMGVSIWCLLKWWDGKNRFWTIFYQYYGKISTCIFYIHTEKLHKMQILFMSDLFCIYIVTIAMASRHFMLFPLIIIYHLIMAKCFLQSENFINSPFSVFVFLHPCM